MLNLSDKELDRFSQEAAQEYEPGDVLGPRSWERLEVRVTQEFGRPGWNPIRHIRRFPFYYAPALLLLLGVGYYLVRPGVSSGSSPGTAAAKTAPASAAAPAQTTTSVPTQKTENTDKATSTLPSSSSSTASRGGVDGSVAPGGAGGVASTPGGAGGISSAPRGAGGASAVPGGAKADRSAAGGAGAARGAVADAMARGSVARGARPTGASGGVLASEKSGKMGIRTGKVKNGGQKNGSDAKSTGAVAMGADGQKGVKAERELSLAYIQRPRSLAKRGVIGDSALRAFNAKSGVPAPIRRKGIYEINRKWQFGLTIAPDFASVNSLAGDKAGSSIGLTVDYLFAPHWYLNTGILATRRNYAARNQDYHAPPDFYRQYNIYSNGVSLVKGSFYMLEIPLNLRYDFSVAGNTLFFISAGSSSYLMTTENANLYWHWLSRQEVCSSLDHLPSHGTNLFSTVNLSAGVETGLSNSLSLLVAPYMKLPTKKLGIGQVEMNSVGIDFTLKWAPVTGRRRR